VTGQTFAVLLVGALLGSRRGALALITYLLEGAAGLPFFAEASGGLGVITGPTGGYLAGFIVAAFVVGWLAERGWDRRAETTALAMLAGNAAIYLFGLPWLARIVGGENVLAYGLFPFLVGDAIKIVLAMFLLPAGWRVIGSEHDSPDLH
jgi:biotin transporter BioY